MLAESQPVLEPSQPSQAFTIGSSTADPSHTVQGVFAYVYMLCAHVHV